jgi:hypothetical protein
MELVNWCRMQWDRVLAVAAVLVGVGCLIAGWIGVSGTEFVADQVPYVISGGLGGLVLLVIGGSLWVSADLKDEWRKLDRLEESFGEADGLADEVRELRHRVVVLEELASLSARATEDPIASNGGRIGTSEAGRRPARSREAR